LISVGTRHAVAVSKPATAKDSNKEQEIATRRGETYDYLFAVHSAITFS